MPFRVAPEKVACYQLHLRFFDFDACVRSDDGEFIELFARMYRRFLVDNDSPAGQPLVEFTLLAKTDLPGGKPVMVLDGETIPLNDSRLLDGFVYESILSAMVVRVRSHILVHAGVVSCAGNGVLIVAYARHGKTTLVLELTQLGFKFLSDETAALGRIDHRVHPFPRSLRIRPGTLHLLGISAPRTNMTEWLGKQIIDIEEVQPGGLGEPVPVSHIVVLTDPAEAKCTVNNEEVRQELSVMVDRADEALINAISYIPGIGEVKINDGSNYPTIKICAMRPIYTLSQVESLCKIYGVLILDVIRGKEGSPTFESPAILVPIPATEAVIELLKRFQGGYKSAILQGESGGGTSRLFMELSAIIGQARCYQLSVGPLKQMASLVCNCIN